MTRKDIVELVCRGLCRARPTCYLIDIPPGCEDRPDLATRIHERFCRDMPRGSVCAHIAVGTFDCDDQIADALIGGWVEKSDELKGHWQQRRNEEGDDEAGRFRLKAFGTLARKRGLHLYACFSHFDRVFRFMSGPFLAVLRDLEQQTDVMTTVNISPLPYEELYRRRRRDEPAFTSDYGQRHCTVPVRQMEKDEAQDSIAGDVGFSPATRLEAAYFGAAYCESGGFSVALEHAARELPLRERFDSDLRTYVSNLRRTLPAVFQRFLRHLDAEERHVIESLARLQLGPGREMDRALLREHNWHALLIGERDQRTVPTCFSLGEAAVRHMAQTGKWVEPAPVDLYCGGKYALCMDALRRVNREEQLLELAAKMMAEVFRDDPCDLYLRADIDWRRVKDAADQACALCVDPAARKQFEDWGIVADVYARCPRESRDGVERYLGDCSSQTDVDSNLAIPLAIRLLAVMADRNPVTAAYSAVPLIEDLLRFYVVCILKLAPVGASFGQVSSESIKRWWQGTSPFDASSPETKLAAAGLAILVAARSDETGQPLFSSPTELSQILALLDNARNPLGHYVLNPDAKVVGRLIGGARTILGAMVRVEPRIRSLDVVRSMVRQPMEFLNSGQPLESGSRDPGQTIG